MDRVKYEISDMFSQRIRSNSKLNDFCKLKVTPVHSCLRLQLEYFAIRIKPPARAPMQLVLPSPSSACPISTPIIPEVLPIFVLHFSLLISPT